MVLLDFQAVLFDLDGTLVNSQPAIERSVRRWAAEHGLDEEYVLARAEGRQDADLVAEVAPDQDIEREAARIAELEAADTTAVHAVVGARRLLDSLPHDRWAIVTSGTYEVASARLRAAGLPRPEVFLTADVVQHGKPHPSGYLTAADRLGFTPEECLIFEDTATGVKASVAAGIRCVGVGDDVRPAQGSETVASISDFTSVELRHGDNAWQLVLG
ncbi:HAD-IA family hydrolase [Haloglycomyces albus]|uniref:HAD-IA family hydrolase n=1 Tax=Haloglycomyces albus TaxID=526067 RepID=UPI00046CEC1A|nr:HAD-IA family hydrolase [Haloglycomyces albus]